MKMIPELKLPSPILTTLLLSIGASGATAQEAAEAAVEPAVTPRRQAADEEQLPVRSAPTDGQITDAIEDELQSDDAVVSTFVDVATIGGIVTLTGSVDNLLAKERAARLATAVRGVRAVVNRVVVDDSDRSNPAIERDIDDALRLDPATESYDIEVEVTGGHAATMTGEVASYAEKTLAGRVAKGVRGVRSLDNAITVAYPTERSDQEIETDISGRLRWNRFLDDGLITISVDDGKVVARGVVGSAAEKQRLDDLAWVAGVKAVDVDEVAVQRWARDTDLRGDKFAQKSDGRIEQAVIDTLRHDPRVYSFDVRPEVNGGVVTLRGQVDNLKAKRAAAQNAENCVGVFGVDNRIKVRPVVVTEDDQVQLKIESALRRDPWVESYEIIVGVDRGNVTLYGTVDTQFDKARADDVAARVAGVADVDNLLAVSAAGTQGYDPYVDDWYTPTDFPWYQQYSPIMTLRSDDDIAAAIRARLWWSPFVDDGDVSIDVTDGCARLTGAVDSLSESMAAVENAFEGGAVRVVNDLAIGGSRQ